MIGRISGHVLEKHANTVLIDVNGVGYEVEMPLTDLCALGQSGTQVVVHTHFVVREDAQLLYGFLSKVSREMFRLLIRINGVGPKMALAILSGMDVAELVVCFQSADAARLVRVPGVGKKTAERLIVEMQDRIAAFDEVSPAIAPNSPAGSPVTPASLAQEAEDALVALGYKPSEAAKVIKSVLSPGDTVEDVIRNALKGMVKGR